MLRRVWTPLLGMCLSTATLKHDKGCQTLQPPQTPTILNLAVYAEEFKPVCQRNLRTSAFITAALVIVKVQKLPMDK